MNNIIQFPRFAALKKSMDAQGLQSHFYSEGQLSAIHDTVTAIRQYHGEFNPHHLQSIIELIDNDWLPEDIPVLLP